MVQILRNIKFEEDCRKTCRRKTYIVYDKEIKEKHIMREAHISFHPKVLVTERVANYDMFKYIIDVGSSLGLWLGLSVLGLL